MAITEEQRHLRRNYLGSSDMAALFGLDPYGRNAHDIYLEKTGQLPEREPTKAMQLGTRLESYVLDWAEQGDDDWSGLGKLDRRVETQTLRGGHLCAHVDATLLDLGVPVEAKTQWFGRTNGEWGDDGTGAVPDHVNIQVHVQMLCLGAEHALVVALLPRGLSHFRVERVESVCMLITENAKRFWEENVIPKVPPKDVLPSLESLGVRLREPKKRVELDNAFYIDWRTAKNARKGAEKEEKTAKAALLAAIGDAEEGLSVDAVLMNWPLITYYEQTRRGVDTKKLFADHPELKEAYATESRHRVLREKKL